MYLVQFNTKVIRTLEVIMITVGGIDLFYDDERHESYIRRNSFSLPNQGQVHERQGPKLNTVLLLINVLPTDSFVKIKTGTTQILFRYYTRRR